MKPERSSCSWMGVAVPFSVLGFYGRGADEGSARAAWDGGDAMQYPDR